MPPHWLVVGQHDNTRLVDELLDRKTVYRGTNHSAFWEEAQQQRKPQTLLLDGNVSDVVFATTLAFGRERQVDVACCCATQDGTWCNWVLLFDYIYLFGEISDAVVSKFDILPTPLQDLDWGQVAEHNRDPLNCTRLIKNIAMGKWTIDYLSCVPRMWSCKEHWRFPKAERDRVYCLLLGRTCPQSYLHCLDASLLHRIVEYAIDTMGLISLKASTSI